MKKGKKLCLIVMAYVLALPMIVGINTSLLLAADVGVAWVGKSGMAKRVSAGLETGLEILDADIRLEFQKELGSLDDLAALTSKWEQEKEGRLQA